MNKFNHTLILLIATIILACNEDKTENNVDTIETNQNERIAGNISKKWQIIKTPESDNSHESCLPTHERNLDNYYVFYANNDFHYDNGTIHDDPNCEYGECCSDLYELFGTWELNTAQDSLYIWISQNRGYEGDTSLNTFPPSVFLKGKINSLTDSLLIINMTSTETNESDLVELQSR